MKRRLTCRRGFDRYKSDGLVCAIQLDHVEADEVEHAVITENDERWIDGGGCTIIRQRRDSHYLVGEIANRLYEYEQLGYSPEELKEIIDDRKKFKERLNSLYGTTISTIPDNGVKTQYPYIYIENLGRQHGKTSMQAKAIFEYLKNDAEFTNALANSRQFAIRDVIFNDPATIVFWADGTKTVVKADKEDFDPEKGLAMAISKKALGNKGNYFDIFKKWTAKYTAYSKPLVFNVEAATKGTIDGLNRAAEKIHSLSQTLVESQRRKDMRTAFELLNAARKSPRITKAELIESIETAMTYLRDF